MTKPWDNEPSLEADKSWMYPQSFDADTKVVSHEKLANLERRLRHAERLLEKSWKTRKLEDIDQLHDDVMEHLEAARLEGGR